MFQLLHGLVLHLEDLGNEMLHLEAYFATIGTIGAPNVSNVPIVQMIKFAS